MRLPFLILSFLIWLVSSCQTDYEIPVGEDRPYQLSIPEGFPAPDIPPGKELTVNKVELGKQLFFDKRLSADNTISCGTCHIPSKAFADNNDIGKGIEGRKGFRNVPSQANIAYHPYFLKDGGATSLEAQVLVPLKDHNEMDFSLEQAAERLSGDPVYEEYSLKSFGKKFDAEVLIEAIAAFERTLISGNSKFDQYKRGLGDLNDSEKKGMQIFNLNCASCHSNFDFTDYSFQNNGLYLNYEDKGRGRITLNPEDDGKFKVPSLRNVAVTAPFMHNGSLKSLEEVVNHYNVGGKPHPNKSKLIKPLNLSVEEQKDLINFLHTLTDPLFLADLEKLGK